MFSVLVLTHEWGHFAAARACGIKAEEFGLGLPPRAKTLFTDRKGTAFTLNWLPLGGFVRMKGENKKDRGKDAFHNKTIAQRSVVLLGGVTVNVVTGWLLYVLIFTTGYATPVSLDVLDRFQTEHAETIVSVEELGVYLARVLPDSPAQAAGLESYDFVQRVDGHTPRTLDELQTTLAASAGSSVQIQAVRRELPLSVSVPVPESGLIGVEVRGPFVGVTQRYGLGESIYRASDETARILGAIGTGLADLGVHLFTKFALPDHVGGPVRIAQETHYRTSSLSAVLTFMAALSLMLGFFNVLPIPALDGGRLLLVWIEGLIRRPVPERVETAIHAAGFVMLMIFVLFVTRKDIFG